MSAKQGEIFVWKTETRTSVIQTTYDCLICQPRQVIVTHLRDDDPQIRRKPHTHRRDQKRILLVRPLKQPRRRVRVDTLPLLDKVLGERGGVLMIGLGVGEVPRVGAGRGGTDVKNDARFVLIAGG